MREPLNLSSPTGHCDGKRIAVVSIPRLNTHKLQLRSGTVSEPRVCRGGRLSQFSIIDISYSYDTEPSPNPDCRKCCVWGIVATNDNFQDTHLSYKNMTWTIPHPTSMRLTHSHTDGEPHGARASVRTPKQSETVTE